MLTKASGTRDRWTTPREGMQEGVQAFHRAGPSHRLGRRQSCDALPPDPASA